MLRLIFVSYLFYMAVPAWGLQCVDLFLKPDFIEINVFKKSVTKDFFDELKSKSIDKEFYRQVRSVLKEITKHGAQQLSPEQIETIIEFRQDISFLRSSYEILTEDHRSPKKFNEFVRSFGKLKDLVLMKEHDQSKKIAKEILEDISFKKLENMVKDEKLAGRKSIKLYIEDKVKTIDHLLYKVNRTVDELHTLRKSLRNIYRYLEIQHKVVEKHSPEREILKYQLSYLKSLNKDLGEICDRNATDILSGHLKKTDSYEMTTDLFNRIQEFLNKISILDNSL